MGILLLLAGLGWVALAVDGEDTGSKPTPDSGDVPSEDPEADPGEDEGEVIVVTGLGREEDASRAVHHTRVITADEISRMGVQSVGDALELQPGVQVVQGIGGEGISMQGLEPEHTLILVDGVRMSGRVNGTLDLRRLSLQDVEQIEIVEGPAATLYGSDAMAGVIHIRTKRGKQGVSGDVQLITGRFASPTRTTDESLDRALPVEAVDTLDATGSLSFGTERAKIRLHAGWHAAEATDTVPEDAGTTVNAFRQLRLGGAGDFDVGPGHTWNAQARWQAYRRWGIDSLPTGSTLDRVNLTGDWGGSIGPTFQIDDRRTLTLSAGMRGWNDQFRVDQRGSDRQDDYQRTIDVLIQARARYDTVAGERHVLAVGAEVLGERLTAERLDPKQVDRSRVALFVQERWDPLGDDVIAVEAAVRGDYDTRFGAYATPRAGLRIAPDDRFLFRIGGGRGFRAPDFREMFLVFENAAAGYRIDGTEDLRPETSWNLQGGAELRPTSATHVGLRGFYNDLSDLIQADLVDTGGPGEPQRFAYVNVASARTAGGELELGVDEADLGGVSAVYRYTDTKDRQTELPLSGRARHQLSGQVTLRLPVWDGVLSSRATWFGPRGFVRTDSNNELIVEDAPSTLNIDASLVLNPHERVSVQLGVENLADAGADPESLLQARPRRVYLGLSGNFGTPTAASAPANATDLPTPPGSEAP